MTEKYQPIPHRLKNMAVGGHVAGAEDIDAGNGKTQQDINADTYRKNETYSKEQLNNMITTPEQEYLSVTATSETTDVDDIATLIATKYPDGKESADTVYRVGCWDGEQYDTGVYTEYVWDGTQYIPVGVKNHGIDDTPIFGSNNFVESDGIALANEKMELQEKAITNRIVLPTATQNDKICNSDGSISTSEGWNIFEFEIDSNKRYVVTATFVNTTQDLVFYYDSNNTFISKDRYKGNGEDNTVFNGVILDVPSNATKMRINVYVSRPKTVVKTLGDEHDCISVKSKAVVTGTLVENKRVVALTGETEDSTGTPHYNVFTYVIDPTKEYTLTASLRSTSSVFAAYYDSSDNHICDDLYFEDGQSVTEIKDAYLHIPSNAATLKVNAYSNLPAPILNELGKDIESSELKEGLESISVSSLMEKVVLPTKVVPEVIADYTDGSIDESSSWNVFEYEIEEGTMYAFDATLVNTTQHLVLYYDENDVFIGAEDYKGNGTGDTVFENAVLHIPSKAAIVRINVLLNRPNTVLKTFGSNDNVPLREKTPIEGTLVESKRINTLRGTLSDSTDTAHYNVFEYDIDPTKEYALTASLRLTASIFAAYYDEDDEYICDDVYHGDNSSICKITNAYLHVPSNAVTLRVNGYSNLPDPVLNELGDIIDSDTLQENINNLGSTGFAPILLKGRPYYAHYNIINANHPTIDENTIIAPSQSLFDIELCARLGFTAIELNAHETSDGKFVCFHGTANKFDSQFRLSDDPTGLFAETADFTTLYVSEVTLADIKASLVNKAKYAKYRTPPCTLEECLYECRRWSIMPLVTFTAKTQPIIDSIMGKSDYIGYIGGQGNISPELRALTSSMLVVFDNTTESVDDVIANCDALGGCVLYCAAKIDSKDESVVIDYVEKMHKKGYFVAGIPFDRNEASNQKYLRCNYDGLCSAWNINRLEQGNICELGADIDFSDFTHNGTVSGGVLTLANGNTIVPNFTIPSVFLGGAYLELKFTGTLTVQMGEKVNETITSSGEKIVTFSSSFFESAPTFLITSSGSTTVTEIHFKASKL